MEFLYSCIYFPSGFATKPLWKYMQGLGTNPHSYFSFAFIEYMELEQRQKQEKPYTRTYIINVVSLTAVK